MTTTEPADLVGSVEAGRILGRSPRTVTRLVASGALVPVMTAPGGAFGAYLFARADVERLAREQASA